MRIKHFYGYGSVSARKVFEKKLECVDLDHYGEPMKQMSVLVEGNHERGIETRDRHTLYNWIIKRFAKVPKEKVGYIGIEESGYKKVLRNGCRIDEEYVVYTFNFLL